jgi:hypothetical protein
MRILQREREMKRSHLIMMIQKVEVVQVRHHLMYASLIRKSIAKAYR